MGDCFVNRHTDQSRTAQLTLRVAYGMTDWRIGVRFPLNVETFPTPHPMNISGSPVSNPGQ